MSNNSFDLIREMTAIMQPRLNKEVQSLLSKLCKVVARQDQVIDLLEERVSKLELKLKEQPYDTYRTR